MGFGFGAIAGPSCRQKFSTIGGAWKVNPVHVTKIYRERRNIVNCGKRAARSAPFARTEGNGLKTAADMQYRQRVRPPARVAGRAFALTILCALACLEPARAQWFAPTHDIASKCRALAYNIYPNQRPGHTAGSGARYSLFKDCLAKGGNVDETTLLRAEPTTPPPQLGPPPETQPAREPAPPR
jgi:hypothetical protein